MICLAVSRETSFLKIIEILKKISVSNLEINKFKNHFCDKIRSLIIEEVKNVYYNCWRRQGR